MSLVKKMTAIIAAAVILTSVSVSAYADTPVNLVIFGDSIATGYGLDGYTSGKNDSAAGSFANTLYSTYKKDRYKTYSNYAVDGMTSGDVLNYLEDADAPQLTYASEPVNLVISIGGNDLLNPLYGAIGKALESQRSTLELMGVKVDTSTPNATMATLNSAVAADKTGTVLTALQVVAATPENWSDVVAAAGSFDRNYDAICKKLYATVPEAKIYVLTVYNPFEGVPGLEMLSVASDNVISSLNASIVKSAAKYNAEGKYMTVVDVNAAFKGKALALTNMSRLDIHPNAEGHELIAHLLMAYMEPTSIPATGRNETLPVVILVISLGAAVIARPGKRNTERTALA